MTPEEIISYVDLTDKESIVDLLFAVQGGTISCRKAAGVLTKSHGDALIREWNAALQYVREEIDQISRPLL